LNFERLLQVIGLQDDPPPEWLNRGKSWAASWISKGLTADRIITAAKAHRNAVSEPPWSPSGLDKAMQREAEKRQKKTATEDEILRMIADQINGDGYFSAASLSAYKARCLLEAGYVTQEKLKERGIAA
jgi:hypothetical protein